MKPILPKPFRTHRDVPAIKSLTDAPKVATPRQDLVYQQLVTRQNVHPDRARELLGMPVKKVVAF